MLSTQSDPMLTPAEAARVLNVSTRTLANYVHEGKLASYNYSLRCRRYQLSDLQEFLAKKHQPVKIFCE